MSKDKTEQEPGFDTLFFFFFPFFGPSGMTDKTYDHKSGTRVRQTIRSKKSQEPENIKQVVQKNTGDIFYSTSSKWSKTGLCLLKLRESYYTLEELRNKRITDRGKGEQPRERMYVPKTRIKWRLKDRKSFYRRCIIREWFINNYLLRSTCLERRRENLKWILLKGSSI